MNEIETVPHSFPARSIGSDEVTVGEGAVIADGVVGPMVAAGWPALDEDTVVEGACAATGIATPAKAESRPALEEGTAPEGIVAAADVATPSEFEGWPALEEDTAPEGIVAAAEVATPSELEGWPALDEDTAQECIVAAAEVATPTESEGWPALDDVTPAERAAMDAHVALPRVIARSALDGESTPGRASGTARAGAAGIFAGRPPRLAAGRKWMAAASFVVIATVVAVVAVEATEAEEPISGTTPAMAGGPGAPARFDEAVRAIGAGDWGRAVALLEESVALDPSREESARYLDRARDELAASGVVARARRCLDEGDVACAEEAVDGIATTSLVSERQADSLRAAIAERKAQMELEAPSHGAGGAGGAPAREARSVGSDWGRPAAPGVTASASGSAEKARGGWVPGGKASGGEASDGYASGGKASSGKASGGKPSGGGAYGVKASGGKAPGGKTSGGERSSGKASGGMALGGRAPGAAIGGAKSSGPNSDEEAGPGGGSGKAALVRRLVQGGVRAKNTGNLELATERFGQALAMDPGQPEARSELDAIRGTLPDLFRRAYAEMGSEPESAARSFRLVTRLAAPGDPLRAKAEKWLARISATSGR